MILSAAPVKSLTTRSSSRRPPQFIGFDLGTSGARISVIEPMTTSSNNSGNNSDEEEYREIYSQAVSWGDNGDGGASGGAYDDAESWMTAIETLLQGAADHFEGGLEDVARLCVSGTSASCLVADRSTLEVTRPPRMYNYDILSSTSNTAVVQCAKEAMDILERHVPSKHTSRARTGSLAKLLAWARERPMTEAEVFCHQSDYVSASLMHMHDKSNSHDEGVITSDWHNCLKLGYDVRNDCWPNWIKTCMEVSGIANPLQTGGGAIPLRVLSPGSPMGTVSPSVAKRFGLGEDTIVVGGTTDSNAAFFAAAGAGPQAGTAVTSLGSTLAIKLLSAQFVEDADRGIYSHRFPSFSDNDVEKDPQKWLVGGASNVGCAIFGELQFSNDELDKLSAKIDPSTDCPLSYYPLTKMGERFPVADAYKIPILTPVPDSRQDYLHGLLQSIAFIERDGFDALRDLGAPYPSVVWTCGGGSRNAVWSQMRERILQAKGDKDDILRVRRAANTEASYGAALLAAASYK